MLRLLLRGRLRYLPVAGVEPCVRKVKSGFCITFVARRTFSVLYRLMSREAHAGCSTTDSGAKLLAEGHVVVPWPTTLAPELVTTRGEPRWSGVV